MKVKERKVAPLRHHATCNCKIVLQHLCCISPSYKPQLMQIVSLRRIKNLTCRGLSWLCYLALKKIALTTIRVDV